MEISENIVDRNDHSSKRFKSSLKTNLLTYYNSQIIDTVEPN